MKRIVITLSILNIQAINCSDVTCDLKSNAIDQCPQGEYCRAMAHVTGTEEKLVGVCDIPCDPTRPNSCGSKQICNSITKKCVSR